MPTQAEIDARADVLARKLVWLITYEIELTDPTPERANLKGCIEHGQIVRPSANPHTAMTARFQERRERCAKGKATPGFYFLLAEQGTKRFTWREGLKVHGPQAEMMARGDSEEKAAIAKSGGKFRGLQEPSPQSLNFGAGGQGDAWKHQLGHLLADHLVENELARGSNPG